MGPNVITTVVAPATNYDLTTLAVVKDELNITTGKSDAKLKRYITSASAAAAQFCNRVFQSETIKDEFWAQRDRWPLVIPGGSAVLQLSRWPIVSVTSVVEDGVTLVDQTDFRIDYANGQLTRLDVNLYPKMWPVYPIVVNYVGGFATVPTDVADAVIRMVRSRFNSRSDPYLKQETIVGVRDSQWWIPTGSDAGNMTPDVEDILNNYRVPVVL